MHKYRRFGKDKLNLWPFYHWTFKCVLDLQPSQTSVSNGTTTLHWEHLLWNGGSEYNEQMFQMALLLFKENNCAKLLWNICINIEDKAKTSLIYDHFIIGPSSVSWTFNLPKQVFQMALLLFIENTCAKLFWNPRINVEVMAPTSSIYGNFIVWLSSVTLTFNLPKQMFQTALLLSKENTCSKLFWNPCINIGVIGRLRKSGGQKIDLISSLLNKFFLKLCIPLSITYTNSGKETQNF